MAQIPDYRRGPDFVTKLDLGPYIRPQAEMTKRVAEYLANDHEQKVRQALIDLGWTPPKDS